MKKQNIIIIGIFIIFVFGFYLISCNDDEIIYDTIVTQKEYVTVKISGEVYREGEYRVPSYWTLKSLLDYVGVKETADLSDLDLTILIEEGSCYIITCLESKKTESNSKININTASKEELMSISGIGESIANKIISYRKNTPFKTISDIKKVSGIGESLYEKIKDFITA